MAGDLVDPETPRRWLLVSREQSVPADEANLGRWSLDHLFLDQDAIPTLVEVKRSSDTRIRREVIGQMLDYAANAVAYLPVEALQARLDAGCAQRGEKAVEAIQALLGPGGVDEDVVERFWQQVKTNLQAGRIRLIFVADEIPSELRRVVEFLNQQMDPAEVLAVEIKQYVGDGVKTLVPQIFGQTETARQRKRPTPRARTPWTSELLRARLAERCGPDVAALAGVIEDWIRPLVTRIEWGTGPTDGSMIPILEIKGGTRRGGDSYYFFTVWSSGSVEVGFQHLRGKPGFADDADRFELLRRLNQIPGANIPDDAFNRRPSFKLALLSQPEGMIAFRQAIEWAIEKVTRVTV